MLEQDDARAQLMTNRRARRLRRLWRTLPSAPRCKICTSPFGPPVGPVLRFIGKGRWPGAKAHDYFASVKRGKSYVSVYLLVADTYPDALEGASVALLKRRTDKAAFNFPELDESMAADLRALLGRLYVRYRADHAGSG